MIIIVFEVVLCGGRVSERRKEHISVPFPDMFTVCREHRIPPDAHRGGIGAEC